MEYPSAGVRAFKAIEANGLFPAELTNYELVDLISLIVGAYLRTSPPETATEVFQEAALFTPGYIRAMQEKTDV